MQSRRDAVSTSFIRVTEEREIGSFRSGSPFQRVRMEAEADGRRLLQFLNAKAGSR
jgi:hypothetical protein